MFDNMLDFIPASMLAQLTPAMDQRKYSQDQLVNLVLSGSLVQAFAPCIVHKHCRSVCRAARAFIHCAGPPCVDWSTQNTRGERGQFGPTFLVTLTWCAQRLLIKEPVLLHENILAFDLEVLIACLGAVYCLFPGELDVASLGWPVHRRRRLTLCIRKDLMQTVHYPWHVFLRNCCRVTTACWLEFTHHTHEIHIQETLDWMRSRPTSMYNMSRRQRKAAIRDECEEWGANMKAVLRAADQSPFTHALLASECRRLVEYRRLANASEHGCKYLCCLLGQEPGPHAQYSTSPVLNTIIRKTVIAWADPVLRPLTGFELMSAQGFVTHPSCSLGGVLSSSFLLNRSRHRAAVGEQAGNSMPVNFVGLALMWVAAAIDIREPMSLDPMLAKVVSLHKRGRS